MRKRLLLLSVVLAAVLCAAVPGAASAINTTGGEFDGNDHPTVGEISVPVQIRL